MRYNNISFNEAWVKSLTEDDFAQSPYNWQHWPDLTQEEREEKLRTLWRILNPKSDENDREHAAKQPEAEHRGIGIQDDVRLQDGLFELTTESDAIRDIGGQRQDREVQEHSLREEKVSDE